MDGYKLFRRDGQERRGSRIALHFKVCFDCLELNDGDNRIEYLWVRESSQQGNYHGGSLL